MAYTEGVQTGAAAIRRSSPVSPLEVLARMRETDQTGSYERLFKKWCDRIEGRPEYLDAVMQYAFRNYWTALDKSDNAAKYDVDKRRRDKERLTEEIEELATEVSNIVLMNLLLPSGKMLKDSTFAECAKAGGFFSKIAKMGKPNAIVGKTTDEAALRKLWLKK
jgi:hypothetical protein